MRFLADESVDGPVVKKLREDGCDIKYIAEMTPGITDEKVLQIANDSRALLLTADKDFGELVFRLRRIVCGVVLIRLSGLPVARKAAIVSGQIAQHGQEMFQAFTVISPGLIRIRNT